MHFELVLRQSAGQQAQLLCRTRAVERVDDVEDALFQQVCPSEPIFGLIRLLPKGILANHRRSPIVACARPGVQMGAIARAYADLSGDEVARLAQFEEQSKAFPLWVKECIARWEMLGRPRRPLNRQRIAESQAAYQRGEGEPVSETIARLEQGGPLVKE